MRRTLLVLLPALLLSGCVTTTTRTTSWGDEPYATPAWRYGSVVSIRETVTRQQGNPAGGAVAGALIGAAVGADGAGHGHYDRRGRYHRHGSGAGALAGAAIGAVVGAIASSGPPVEDRTYEVFVRFEDGGVEPFVYRGGVPFRIGDEVGLGPDGLVRL